MIRVMSYIWCLWHQVICTVCKYMYINVYAVHMIYLLWDLLHSHTSSCGSLTCVGCASLYSTVYGAVACLHFARPASFRLGVSYEYHCIKYPVHTQITSYKYLQILWHLLSCSMWQNVTEKSRNHISHQDTAEQEYWTLNPISALQNKNIERTVIPSLLCGPRILNVIPSLFEP